MTEMPYPYYKLQSDGPSETGFTLKFQIEEGAGGPLDGKTTDGVLDSLKQLLTGDGTTVSLIHYEVTTTNNL
jgi:hypothetical protein